MNFIKHYWFNLLMALVIVFGMGFTVLIALSPREDMQKRGFIPCTEQLADEVSACGGNLWCTAKAVFNNGRCDAKVILRGFRLWLKGEQPRPWSNYIFIPEIKPADNALYENSELFYQENPEYRQDFEKLKQNHQKLEEENTHEQPID